MSASETPRLVLRGITKRYPTVVANENVDLTVRVGEIHAVIGENGAGKSTLMKMIYGVSRPDEGTIEWEGRPVRLASPAEARRLGIGMVFQHFALFETLTVAENIALALDEKIKPAALAPRIRDVSERYGLPVDPNRLTHSMSVGERQRVEIVRCLLQSPRLLIMDEPTSVLTPQAVLKLFETLRRLSGEGVSILYISHKLDEIRALCDTATVLRGGKVSGVVRPREESNDSLARLMVGGELAECRLEPREAGRSRLSIVDFSMKTWDPFGTELKHINLDVREGAGNAILNKPDPHHAGAGASEQSVLRQSHGRHSTTTQALLRHKCQPQVAAFRWTQCCCIYVGETNLPGVRVHELAG